MHSYLLSIYYMTGSVPCAGNIELNQTDRAPAWGA